MPYAITLRFDPCAASAVERMWEALAAQGIDADRKELGYAPHVTLAVYPDGAPVGCLRAGLGRAAARWDALPMLLSGFGVFPGPAAVLYVAPVVTPGLLAMRAALQDELPGLQTHPHYRPGAWVPHVTLSGALDDPGRALMALLPTWRRVNGMVNRADLVRFRPVQVLQSHDLPIP